jgi:hypothetical protein
METNLPLESINVLLEDPVKENMLYVGTDGGVYVSYNKGSQFEPLSDMPPVAVHDMVIQESADELIIGTHGRSLYKLNLGFVRDYQTIKSNKIWLAKISPVKYRGSWGSRGYNWDYIQLELQLTVFKESDAPFEILVQDKDGKELLKEVWEGKAGFVQDTLALAFPNEGTDTRAGDDGMYYPLPGTFKVIVRFAGEEFSQELKVKK